MKAFFSEEQLLHTPRQFMRAGRISKPTDVPARAETLRAMLSSRGIALAAPLDYGRAALDGVHSAAYLDFLEHAYERWQALRGQGPEPGIEVLPNLSPYGGSPAPHARRPPCPSPSIIAQAGYYLGDLSCPIGPHTWRAALRSTHSAVAAADHVLQTGDLAYALCRPSGHHAHHDRAGGFCYLNSSAAAAQRLAHALGRVAVLDVDAHHGDGTQNIFYCRDDVYTVSTHADPIGYYPFYCGYADERGADAGAGCNLNLPLPHGTDGRAYGAFLERALASVTQYQPRALVLALGFDTYKDDPISVLRFDIETYRDIGARVRALGLPTVVVQEGGYQVDSIGQALDAFLQGMAAA